MKIYAWFLFSLLVATAAGAQDRYTEEKTIRRTYALVEGSRLEVANRYGDVVVEHWDKDSVQVVVEIKAQAEKEEHLENLFELAVIQISQRGAFISARTEWGQKSSFWSKSLNELRSLFGPDQEISIDYRIRAPRSLPIQIDLNFGDVYIAPWEGEVSLNLAHGDLRSRSLQNPRKVMVSFGKALVDSWGKGKVELEYAELTSEEAEHLSIRSRSSEIRIDRGGTLTFDSRNDKLNLGDIDQIKGSLHFAKASIKKLGQRCDLRVEYSDLRIEELNAGFANLNLDLKKSDFTMEVDEGASFDFSVYLTRGEKFASVPELITLTRDEQVGDERQIEGYWKSPNSSRTIRITGEAAVVRIAKLLG